MFPENYDPLADSRKAIHDAILRLEPEVLKEFKEAARNQKALPKNFRNIAADLGLAYKVSGILKGPVHDALIKM